MENMELLRTKSTKDNYIALFLAIYKDISCKKALQEMGIEVLDKQKGV